MLEEHDFSLYKCKTVEKIQICVILRRFRPSENGLLQGFNARLPTNPKVWQYGNRRTSFRFGLRQKYNPNRQARLSFLHFCLPAYRARHRRHKNIAAPQRQSVRTHKT